MDLSVFPEEVLHEFYKFVTDDGVYDNLCERLETFSFMITYEDWQMPLHSKEDLDEIRNELVKLYASCPL
jgi:hypothetical protein